MNGEEYVGDLSTFSQNYHFYPVSFIDKERINSGKELLNAKRMAEENDRKRCIARYEADKEEKKRAMERIRQKLQQDKAERRGRLSGEDSLSDKPASFLLHEQNENPKLVDHGSVPVNYTRKRADDLMTDCLRSLLNESPIWVPCLELTLMNLL